MAKKTTSSKKTRKTVSARKKTVKQSAPVKRKKTVARPKPKKTVVVAEAPEFNSANLMDAVQELEEVTSKAKDVAVQLIRTEELQDDLNGNCERQVSEKEGLLSCKLTVLLASQRLWRQHLLTSQRRLFEVEEPKH